MFLVISVYFNLRNILPKSGTSPPGHPVYSDFNDFLVEESEDGLIWSKCVYQSGRLIYLIKIVVLRPIVILLTRVPIKLLLGRY